MGETYVDTYLGCDIYYLTPPDVSTAQYQSPCITGGYANISAVKKRICQGQGGTWDGSSCSFEEPPEPPPPLEPYLEEVYRDVEIWWVPDISAFRAEVAPGFVATATSLIVIREQIDDILGFLYPPEDPSDGLFAQIVVAVQAWVMENIPSWVLEWGQNIYNTINNIIEYITNVYNDLREYVTNVYNNVYETVENTYNTFREYITNVYNYLTEYVTNIYNNTYNYFTEVIGASVEWVEERLVNIKDYIDSRPAIWDPTGFLADPPTYISGIFSLLGLAKETEMVESFLAGLEEGLTEETEE